MTLVHLSNGRFVQLSVAGQLRFSASLRLYNANAIGMLSRVENLRDPHLPRCQEKDTSKAIERGRERERERARANLLLLLSSERRHVKRNMKSNDGGAAHGRLGRPYALQIREYW